MKDRLPKKSDRPAPRADPEEDRDRLQEFFSRYALAILGAAGVALLAVGYYASEWSSATAFASSMDHCWFLFEDFALYFWPAGNEIFFSGQPVPGFYYSAFSAILFSPFSLLPIHAALWCWGGFQVILAVLLCGLSNTDLPRASPWNVVLSALLLIISFPLLNNFAWGQVSTLITVLILGSLCAYQRKHWVLAGILLAVGTSIKYYPAIFAAYFLVKFCGMLVAVCWNGARSSGEAGVLRRQLPKLLPDFLTLATFCGAVFLCYFLVPVAILGLPDWLRFQEQSFAGVSFLGNWVGWDVNSQYVGNVVIRVLRAVPPSDGRWLGFVGLPIVCANGWLLWRVQKMAGDGKMALSAAVLFLSLPFLVQTSWPHYFVYLPFCQMVALGYILPLLRARETRIRGGILLVVTVFSIALASVFGLNQFPNWKVYEEYGMPFFANALLLGALYGLILTSGRKLAGLQTSKPVSPSPRRSTG